MFPQAGLLPISNEFVVGHLDLRSIFFESAVETHRSRLYRGESDQEIHSLPQPAIFSEGMFRRYAARRS